MAKRTYGRKGIFIKSIMNSVVKPAVLYGSKIWGARANNTANRKLLLAAQRPFLKAMVNTDVSANGFKRGQPMVDRNTHKLRTL